MRATAQPPRPRGRDNSRPREAIALAAARPRTSPEQAPRPRKRERGWGEGRLLFAAALLAISCGGSEEPSPETAADREPQQQEPQRANGGLAMRAPEEQVRTFGPMAGQPGAAE